MSRRTRLATLSSDLVGQEICLRGWLRTVRNSKKFSFLNLNDGSTQSGIQIIADAELSDYEEIAKLTTGSAVEVIGQLVESPLVRTSLRSTSSANPNLRQIAGRGLSTSKKVTPSNFYAKLPTSDHEPILLVLSSESGIHSLMPSIVSFRIVDFFTFTHPSSLPAIQKGQGHCFKLRLCLWINNCP